MAFPGINRFTSAVRDGGARTNLFEVEIAFPGAIAGLVATSALRFHCRGAVIPEGTINVIERPFHGRKIKVAGVRMFQNLNLTIINDEGFSVHRALEAWQSYINSHESNIAASTALTGPTGYARDGLVTAYSQTGAVLRRYRFIDMWPTNIGQINLDWEQDSIQEYPVEFAYQYWVPEIAPLTADPAVTVS